MRLRIALLTACSAIALAGCGGPNRAAPAPPPAPKIPAGLAARLVARADRVAALTPGSCQARAAALAFRTDVISSIGRVPQRYREPLMSAANSLAERVSTCVQPRSKPERRHKRDDDEHGHDNKPKHDEG